MRKIWAGLLTAALLLGGLSGCARGDDGVDDVTYALSTFGAQVEFRSEDVEETLTRVFQETPELYYYFGKHTSLVDGNKVTMDLQYINVDTDIKKVFVVDSYDTLYHVIGLALLDTMEEVAMVITDSTLTTDHIVRAIEEWRHDNYLVYMGYEGAVASTASTDVSSWLSCHLKLDYIVDTDELQEWREETQAEVIEIAESIFALDMPEHQRELAIHDYLVQRTTAQPEAQGASSYTAFGCLVEHQAVCEGYAQAAHLLFQAAGLESYYVEGTGSSSDHAWNCVKVGGDWYWVDVTLDDPIPGIGQPEIVDHTYFNLTDVQMNKDHSWAAASYPSCSSTNWNYNAVVTMIAEEQGDNLLGFTNYSARNVELLEDVRFSLLKELDLTEEELENATPPAALPAYSEEDVPETSDEEGVVRPSETESPVGDGEGEEEKKGGAGKVVLTVVILIILAFAALMIRQRIAYQKALQRRKARERAKKRAAAQNGHRPAGNQRTETASRQRASAGSGQKRPSSAGKKSAPKKQPSARPRNDRRPRRENPFRS